MVPPDLLETTTRVRSGSTEPRMVRTRTGDTESRTLKSRALVSTLLYLVMVMGAWVDPPCPMSSTVVNPSWITCSASSWMPVMG